MSKRLCGWLAALCLGLVLAGCETMSPDECRTANWQDIGLRDGLAGKPFSMLDDRAKDCAKAGTSVDTPQYVRGRERGLQTFCRLENAVPLGLNGSSYAGVCPAYIDHEFRRRHQIAYAVYAGRNRVSELDSRGDRLERRLRDADKDEDKQLRAATKDDDRKRIRKDFDDRRRKIRNELQDVDREMRYARDSLRSAEYALGALR